MRIKDFCKDRKNQIITAVFLITVFIACMPLISRNCINGHDLEYHLLRIESLKEGMRMGKPFLKINTLFFGGAGYASSMFYPDFLLYIPAFLRLIGFSINASYHIFVAICIILTYLSAYYCVKGITGSVYGAMIGAITLSLCQYHLDDIYVRSAVGEYTAFIFIPLVIYAVFNILYENADKPQLFILGYSGLLLCHTATFFMCTLFGLAAILLNFKKTILNKGILIRLVIMTGVTLLLTGFYWIPMLEQFLHTVFYVNTPWMQPKDEAVGFLNIFGNSFPSLGCICVLMLIPRIFIKKGSDPNEGNEAILGYADLLILSGALFTILASDIIPWERIGRYASFIQFPWRFFIMGSVLFSMAAGLIYGSLNKNDDEMTEFLTVKGNTRAVNAAAVILTFILVINGISAFGAIKNGSQGYYDYSDDYYSFKPYTANVIAGEWLPETVRDKERLVDDSEIMLSDKGSKIDFVRVKNTIEADITGDLEYADVPFIYYLGYRAELIKPDGSRTLLKITGEGNNGMCRVYLKDMGNGRLKVYYRNTLLSEVSIYASLISLVVMIIICIKHGRTRLEKGN